MESRFRGRRHLSSAVLGSGIAGAIVGFFKLPQYSGGIGIFALTTFINPETGDMFGVYWVVIAIIIGSIFSFIVTLLFYKEPDPDSRKKISKTETGEISADVASEIHVATPVQGTIIELSRVEDEVFSAEVLGKGCAVIPEEGMVYAPFNGKVMINDAMKHAVSIVSEDGAEVLIHVGMNTVELNGKYYQFHVKNDEQVKKGQKLLSFDMEKIREAGYVLVTPIVVTNSDDYANVSLLTPGDTLVKPGDDLLKLTR